MIKSKVGTNQCITLSDEKDGSGFGKIALETCDESLMNQKWVFRSYDKDDPEGES